MKSVLSFIGAAFLTLFLMGALNIIEFRVHIEPHEIKEMQR